MEQGLIRNEIGSEFWSVPVGKMNNTLFPEQTRWFVSGTSALEYIIRQIQRNTVLKRAALPSWCCSCMIQPFIEAGIDVCFYSVFAGDGNKLTCDFTSAAGCDVTLVLSYFGYVSMHTVGNPAGIVIRDLTHSVFGPLQMDAQYYFGSLRKWAGFWTGGYAWKDGDWQEAEELPAADQAYLRLRRTAMEEKHRYLQGFSQGKAYLELFENAEDLVEQCGIMGSCERDILYARQLDVEVIRKQRRENAAVLLKELKSVALFPELEEQDCPMFVPILLAPKERDALRRYLISKEIYCPVHWPMSELHRLNEKERYLYDHSLSIVCDQRYGSADMQRIINEMKAFYA